MQALVEQGPMARKKKSEVRRHAAILRIQTSTLEQVKLAASLMRMTLADYADNVLSEASEKDIAREARKLAGGNT